MILFYCTAMKDLAERIAENERVILSEINWDEFPDGFPNIFIKNVEQVRNADIAFLASFTPKTIFEQLAVIYALPKYGAKSLKIILPYFPVGTMDRVVKMGEIATAKSLARMISAVECQAELVIYDIHDAREWHYFSGSIVPRLESAIPFLKSRLAFDLNFGQADNLAVAFPDEGARKRFGNMFSEYRQILCHKERLGNKRRVKIMEGKPRRKDVIIVDDLVMTGGTLLECAKLMERKGAKSVSAYVTHAVFPEKSYFNMNEFPFSHFLVTDSCPETIKGLPDCKTKFKVLSLAPLIDKILLE